MTGRTCCMAAGPHLFACSSLEASYKEQLPGDVDIQQASLRYVAVTLRSNDHGPGGISTRTPQHYMQKVRGITIGQEVPGLWISCRWCACADLHTALSRQHYTSSLKAYFSGHTRRRGAGCNRSLISDQCSAHLDKPAAFPGVHRSFCAACESEIG